LISYARRFPFQQGELRAVDELWRVAAGNRGVRRMADLKYGSRCHATSMKYCNATTISLVLIFGGIHSPVWQTAAKDAKVILEVARIE
jgi:hypothetical protein